MKILNEINNADYKKGKESVISVSKEKNIKIVYFFKDTDLKLENILELNFKEQIIKNNREIIAKTF